MKKIDSVANPLVKEISLLQEKSKARKAFGKFVIEGVQEIELALQAGYKLEKILICEAITPLTQKYKANEIISVSKAAYEKLAYRENTEGLIAVAVSKSHEISDLELPENPLILVAEGIEKPGNIGALLRTADAVKADAVILANSISDLYNPNVIRSSVGCVFTVPVVVSETIEAIHFLQNSKIAIYAATLQNANSYDRADFKKATAIAVGAEATGLSNAWRDAASKNIIIPMRGKVDSMNVSVAAAILLFEAARQRGF